MHKMAIKLNSKIKTRLSIQVLKVVSIQVVSIQTKVVPLSILKVKAGFEGLITGSLTSTDVLATSMTLLAMFKVLMGLIVEPLKIKVIPGLSYGPPNRQNPSSRVLKAY